jgi:hypothetical protein
MARMDDLEEGALSWQWDRLEARRGKVLPQQAQINPYFLFDAFISPVLSWRLFKLAQRRTVVVAFCLLGSGYFIYVWNS